jgi:LAO/AO transport system kinase
VFDLSTRRGLAKAITLIESSRPQDAAAAEAMLNIATALSGKALRLGISGVPGVGKSTFIESFGLSLIRQGFKVAVLAVDPSSVISGGSILGDKTRMEQLAVHEQAFIRPSPSSGTLGGVAQKTRETMLLCEAAGYDVIIVETVGVGQSEISVANMVDCYLLMLLPNAGDDLQAIKRGVMERADLIIINKADLDPDAATRAQAQVTSTVRLLRMNQGHDAWLPPVLNLSALNQLGLGEVWSAVQKFQQHAGDAWAAKRKQQAEAWMWERIGHSLLSAFKHNPAIKNALPQFTQAVLNQTQSPSSAAAALLALHHQPS